MAKSSYKSKEEATKAQEVQKEVVVANKKSLTSYLKKNGLDRDKDYSKDKKHGKKIKALQLEIDKSNETLVEINEAVTSLKGSKAEKTEKGKSSKGKSEKSAAPAKYDYPEGLTSDEKKKYRQLARKGKSPAECLAEAKGTAKKETKAPKEKEAKEEKSDKTSKKDKKGKSSKEEAPEKEAKLGKKDKGGKDKKKGKKKSSSND